jgi:hypothetical protein
MSAAMSAAYIASLPHATLDWDASAAALDKITDPTEFGWDHFDLESEAEFLDGPTCELTDLATLKKYGGRVLTELKDALDSRDTTLLTIGGYWVYLTAGLGSGDGADDEYEAICAADGLPDLVLKAAGFVLKPEDPPSRRAGAQGHVTDTDVVDAIALGLGTKRRWRGREELTWIADAVAKVRPDPYDADPVDYYEDFSGQSEFDPLADDFLSRYVGEEASDDDHQVEERVG